MIKKLLISALTFSTIFSVFCAGNIAYGSHFEKQSETHDTSIQKQSVECCSQHSMQYQDAVFSKNEDNSNQTEPHPDAELAQNFHQSTRSITREPKHKTNNALQKPPNLQLSLPRLE